uniref:Uncharacterized protein n=1 Tax=Alexandrium catenella TaxID=2925 RepID=A0A7S1W7X7_ALECA|mmetsp:Transcript_42658/g.115038  ORF Transcript_42658/g.115038 Transcript_42658/m.115038 type:complete len:267 (+) Transcript_42658:112-912(+)|eukprot:CAMPEP_0171183360 /NCGR_PEP_ID=MMETSP0790-20130122/15239_1 /TAXON_ID=2925 /ORGANISM="Alexandrium catenella, Strain OF101" /LENGTH=266 /DNA_ID=CAMNT_0011648335 /DNA_START=111 /DNA_END=911 /DNA_ORIENTATION=-
MATSLGWRDVGSVLLSKADAERRRADERRGEEGRVEPVFEGAVMSRRQPRKPPVDRGIEKDEGPALVTDLNAVVEKKPESRLKWLQQALLRAGKNQVKVGVVYDIVTHRRFLIDVRSGIGSQMKALLLANLHLFSTKQQKYFQSDASVFGDFPEAASAASRGGRNPVPQHEGDAREREREREREPSRRHEVDERESSKRRRRSSDTAGRGDAREHEREEMAAPSRTPAEGPPLGRPRLAEGSKARLDPRLFSRGAADEPSDDGSGA